MTYEIVREKQYENAAGIWALWSYWERWKILKGDAMQAYPQAKESCMHNS